MSEIKLYPRKKSVYFFLAMYGLLAAAGVFYSKQALSDGRNPGTDVGFMLVFGAGMFIATLLKIGRPQVIVRGDFLEVRQSRAVQYVRYRHITGFSRPDKMRLVIRLREDGSRTEATIWLKDLDERDIERLLVLLEDKTSKGK